jgi:hypothetical protein
MRQLVFALTVFILGPPAYGQTSNDPRWAPWLGCWELYEQGVYDASELDAAEQGQRSVDDPARPRVCVTPVPPNGASLVTTVGTEKAFDQVVTADGIDHTVDDGECRGTQSAQWFADGLRLFARAQLTCAGDSTPRRVTGLALLAPNGTWLDIQAVDVGGRENVRVRRYRRVLDETGVAAVSKPHIAATRLRLADIKEASTKVSPRVIEAALVETNAGFDLTGRDLIDLDDAGVAGSVVDILVALSYPDRFVVERTRDSRATGGGFFNDPFFLDYGFLSPLDGAFYAPYYYTPFAYSSYGRFYNPGFYTSGFFGPGNIVVGGSAEPQPSGDGRVVDGLGYTRIRERAPERGVATASGGGSSGAGTASSGSSSGGSVTSQGFSSGGSSGGDGGRTAVPR